MEMAISWTGVYTGLYTSTLELYLRLRDQNCQKDQAI